MRKEPQGTCSSLKQNKNKRKKIRVDEGRRWEERNEEKQRGKEEQKEEEDKRVWENGEGNV